MTSIPYAVLGELVVCGAGRRATSAPVHIAAFFYERIHEYLHPVVHGIDRVDLRTAARPAPLGDHQKGP